MFINAYMLYIKFHGAGWMFPFYFGVAKYLKENFLIDSDDIKIGGVSAGAVTAIMLLLDVDFDDVFHKIVRRHDEMRNNPFKIKDCLHDILIEYVPENDEQLAKVQNRLLIGLSKMDFAQFVWKSTIVKEYVSKSKCVDIIKASCHIPVINGIQPYYIDGEGYYDGEISGFVDDVDYTNLLDIDIQSGPNKLTPGVSLPKIWSYFPCDAFILKTIMNLGYARAESYVLAHADKFTKYMSKVPEKTIHDEKLYIDIVEYSKRKVEICHVKKPLISLYTLFPYKGVVIFVIGLLYMLKRYNFRKFIHTSYAYLFRLLFSC
jgi:hypothetical protein